MAQLVKHQTLDFGSGHDLTVCGIKLCIGFCADSVEPAWDSLLSLPLPDHVHIHILSLSPSLSLNK